jgi:hypothetical protein
MGHRETSQYVPTITQASSSLGTTNTNNTHKDTIMVITIRVMGIIIIKAMTLTKAVNTTNSPAITITKTKDTTIITASAMEITRIIKAIATTSTMG